METKINNITCTYWHKINVINTKFSEVLKEKDALDKELRELMRSNFEHENPYYFQSRFIMIETLLWEIPEKIKLLTEKLTIVKYELCN